MKNRNKSVAGAGVAGDIHVFPEGSSAPTSAPQRVRGTALNRNTAETPGWLFVLPWSLKETGGVNEVVKNLVKRFQAGAAFTPQLLISSDLAEPATVGLGISYVHRLNLWPPLDRRHHLRAVMSFLLRFPSRCLRIRQIVRQFNVSVINPHFPELGVINLLIMRKARLFRGMLVLSFHGSDVRGATSTRGIERMFWRILLRGADQIIVVSDDLGREVRALEPRVARNLRTIPNGVDLGLFATRSGEKDLLPSNPTRQHTIVSVGAFRRVKGHDITVRAFACVAKRIHGVRLILVGSSGPEVERTQELIASLSVAGRVEIFQNIPHDQVPGYLTKARLFVLASRGEGFPLAVLEAAAAGLAVICTRAPGLRELITDGVTGRLVDVDDAQGLADAMIDLLSNSEEARRLANNLYEEVKARFTWQRAYESYLELAGPQ